MKKEILKSLQLLSIPIVVLTIVALICCKQFERIKYFEIVRVILVVLLVGSLLVNAFELVRQKLKKS